MRLLGTVSLLLLAFGLFTGCTSGAAAPSATAPSPALAAPEPKAAPLPHFQCYVASGEQPKAHYFVQLKDQFGSHRTAVGPPRLLCTPTDKEVVQGEPLPVPGNADHLVCYAIAGLHHSKHQIQNQLDRQVLEVENAQLLCVPTVKGEPLPQDGGEKTKQ